MKTTWNMFLDVPHIRQESHETCCYAAAKMIQGHFKNKAIWGMLKTQAINK